MSPQGGGRNGPEWVAGINRNGRPEWIGIGGRNQPESVAGMARNTQILPSRDGKMYHPVLCAVDRKEENGPIETYHVTLLKT
jgi:hypothetical protein